MWLYRGGWKDLSAEEQEEVGAVVRRHSRVGSCLIDFAKDVRRFRIRRKDRHAPAATIGGASRGIGR